MPRHILCILAYLGKRQILILRYKCMTSDIFLSPTALPENKAKTKNTGLNHKDPCTFQSATTLQNEHTQALTDWGREGHCWNEETRTDQTIWRISYELFLAQLALFCIYSWGTPSHIFPRHTVYCVLKTQMALFFIIPLFLFFCNQI